MGQRVGPQDYSARVAYRPPSPVYAWLNRHLGVPLSRLGWTPRGVVSLEVRGRTSGRTRATPVVETRHRGDTYIVALAGEAQWVRNVRAAHGEAVLRRRRARRVRLEELPVPDRAPVIAAYLSQARDRGGEASAAGQARSYFGLPPDATRDDIAAVAAHYPVFRVRS